MDVLGVMREWLREEGYIFFSKPPSMMPYKSWIQTDQDKIQLWNADGNVMWISFTDYNTLDLDYYANSERTRRKSINLCDPEAFQDLKKVLDSL